MQAGSVRQEGNLTWVGESRWLSWHLFRDEGLDEVLQRVVRPAVGTLLTRGEIDHFFFIRYPDGGHHVRLRLRLAPPVPHGPELEQRLGALLASLAGPLALRELRQVPFEPEVARYGGEALLPMALDLFLLSSVEALRFVEGSGQLPRARQLMEIMRHLLGHACALARGQQELSQLLDYFAYRRPQFERFSARADQLFETRPEEFVRSFRQGLETMLEQATADVRTEAGQCAADALEALEPAPRQMVKGSLMHMAANRLGLVNAEEIYLTQLLCRCARQLRAQEPSLWQGVEERLRARPSVPEPGRRLSGLASAELRALWGFTPAGGAQEEAR